MANQRMSETTETKKHWTARIIAERDAALQRVRELEKDGKVVNSICLMETEHSARLYSEDELQRIVWKLEDYEKIQKERDDLLTELSDAKAEFGKQLHEISKDRERREKMVTRWKQDYMARLYDVQSKLISVMFGEKPDP